MRKNLALFGLIAGLFLTMGQAFASGYTPIISPTHDTQGGFKAKNSPTSIRSVSWDTSLKMLSYEYPGGDQSQLRFFLPPGTVAVDANFYYYWTDESGMGALRMNNPPTTSLGSITPQNSTTLSTRLNKLKSGEEVLVYSPGGVANFDVLLEGGESISPLVSGGYVYSNFKYPGSQVMRSLWSVYVKASCYEKWFNSPTTKWDSQGNPDESSGHTCDGSVAGGATNTGSTPGSNTPGSNINPQDWLTPGYNPNTSTIPGTNPSTPQNPGANPNPTPSVPTIPSTPGGQVIKMPNGSTCRILNGICKKESEVEAVRFERKKPAICETHASSFVDCKRYQ